MAEGLRPLVRIDGWYTDDPGEYRFYTRDAPSFGYRQQLARDVRSWKPWAWWLLLCVAPVVAMGLTGLLMGAPAAAAYVHMIRRVVGGYRNLRLVEGVVEAFDRVHPLFRGYRVGALGAFPGQPALPEPVAAILPVWAVEAYAQPDGSLEVLVAHAPAAEYSEVIGIRNPRGVEQAP